MALPFEIANFNLLEFANKYNDLYDSDPKDVELVLKDDTGKIIKKKVQNRGKFIEYTKKLGDQILAHNATVNIFSNPNLNVTTSDTELDGLVVGDKKYLTGVKIGYETHIAEKKFSIETDSNDEWWRSAGKRLRIYVKATNDDGSKCCGSWYMALKTTEGIKSIPTNCNNFIPVTYAFEYKVIKKTSSKGFIKIGWERGKKLDSEPSDEWKFARLVYTDPAQRLYFLSLYPGEKNAELELYIRNIVVAPGAVSGAFSNYQLNK